MDISNLLNSYFYSASDRTGFEGRKLFMTYMARPYNGFETTYGYEVMFDTSMKGDFSIIEDIDRKRELFALTYDYDADKFRTFASQNKCPVQFQGPGIESRNQLISANLPIYKYKDRFHTISKTFGLYNMLKLFYVYRKRALFARYYGVLKRALTFKTFTGRPIVLSKFSLGLLNEEEEGLTEEQEETVKKERIAQYNARLRSLQERRKIAKHAAMELFELSEENVGDYLVDAYDVYAPKESDMVFENTIKTIFKAWEYDPNYGNDLSEQSKLQDEQKEKKSYFKSKTNLNAIGARGNLFGHIAAAGAENYVSKNVKRNSDFKRNVRPNSFGFDKRRSDVKFNNVRSEVKVKDFNTSNFNSNPHYTKFSANSFSLDSRPAQFSFQGKKSFDDNASGYSFKYNNFNVKPGYNNHNVNVRSSNFRSQVKPKSFKSKFKFKRFNLKVKAKNFTHNVKNYKFNPNFCRQNVTFNRFRDQVRSRALRVRISKERLRRTRLSLAPDLDDLDADKERRDRPARFENFSEELNDKYYRASIKDKALREYLSAYNADTRIKHKGDRKKSYFRRPRFAFDMIEKYHDQDTFEKVYHRATPSILMSSMAPGFSQPYRVPVSFAIPSVSTSILRQAHLLVLKKKLISSSDFSLLRINKKFSKLFKLIKKFYKNVIVRFNKERRSMWWFYRSRRQYMLARAFISKFGFQFFSILDNAMMVERVRNFHLLLRLASYFYILLPSVRKKISIFSSVSIFRQIRGMNLLFSMLIKRLTIQAFIKVRTKNSRLSGSTFKSRSDLLKKKVVINFISIFKIALDGLYLFSYLTHSGGTTGGVDNASYFPSVLHRALLLPVLNASGKAGPLVLLAESSNFNSLPVLALNVVDGRKRKAALIKDRLRVQYRKRMIPRDENYKNTDHSRWFDHSDQNVGYMLKKMARPIFTSPVLPVSGINKLQIRALANRMVKSRKDPWFQDFFPYYLDRKSYNARSRRARNCDRSFSYVKRPRPLIPSLYYKDDEQNELDLSVYNKPLSRRTWYVNIEHFPTKPLRLYKLRARRSVFVG